MAKDNEQNQPFLHQVTFGAISYSGFLSNPATILPQQTRTRLNTPGVPWYTLCYQENYSRLQKIKAEWDPRNVFRHALSIQPR